MHPRAHAAAASFWQEWYRELRRHAGDERLPYALRAKLRGAADRALGRAEAEEARAVVPRWNRRMLSAAPPAPLSPRDVQCARDAAAARGLDPDRPIVTIDVRHRADRLTETLELLSARGYQIARIEDPAADPTHHLLRSSAFVICDTAGRQHAAYLTQTPSLRLDARDPFTAYPVRRDGVFTLATAIDLDTGRPLAIAELLTERYFRNTRNCGYRATSAADIAAAVLEMLEGTGSGWLDSAAQARFRSAVADAGARLGGHVRHIAEWDAASGFVGEGRLARVQAERTL